MAASASSPAASPSVFRRMRRQASTTCWAIPAAGCAGALGGALAIGAADLGLRAEVVEGVPGSTIRTEGKTPNWEATRGSAEEKAQGACCWACWAIQLSNHCPGPTRLIGADEPPRHTPNLELIGGAAAAGGQGRRRESQQGPAGAQPPARWAGAGRRPLTATWQPRARAGTWVEFQGGGAGGGAGQRASAPPPPPAFRPAHRA